MKTRMTALAAAALAPGLLATGLLATGLLVLAACGQGAVPPPPDPGAPEVSVTRLEDLPTPLPSPYPEGLSEDAVMAQIDAALLRAGAQGKRVIVDLGGNWCSWCRSLAGVMALPEVAPFVDGNFETVFVNVSTAQGLYDQNLKVLERFGAQDISGVPWLIVVEPDGTVLHSSYEVTDENHETPQAMVNWLAQWAGA